MATKKTTTKKAEKQVKKATEVKSKEIKEVKEVKKQPVEQTPIEVPAEATTEKEVKQEPAGFEKKPSAGKQIREMFESVIPKLKDEHLEILTSTEKTKEVLKIRYAFIKEATENKEDRKVNNCPRYGSKTISINGVEYWVTNDLYSRNIEVFKSWIESIK